jgi:hypothetical protein
MPSVAGTTEEKPMNRWPVASRLFVCGLLLLVVARTAEAQLPNAECASAISELRAAVSEAAMQIRQTRRAPGAPETRIAAIREAEFRAGAELDIRGAAIMQSCAPGTVVDIPTISGLIATVCDFNKSLYRIDIEDPGLSSSRTLCAVRQR